MNGSYTIDSKELVKNRNVKVEIQMLKRSEISGPMLTRKSEELARNMGHNDCKGTGDQIFHWNCWVWIVLKSHMMGKTVLL
jgi:hypothetical protein